MARNLILFFLFFASTTFSSVKYIKIHNKLNRYSIETSIAVKDNEVYFLNNSNYLINFILGKISYKLPIGYFKIKADKESTLQLINELVYFEKDSLKTQDKEIFHTVIRYNTQNGYLVESKKNLTKIYDLIKNIIFNFKFEKIRGEVLEVKDGNINLTNIKYTNNCSSKNRQCKETRFGLLF